VRPRHYWHSAEWLRTVFNVPFVVRHAGFTYKLPPHSSAPRQTFVSDPFEKQEGARSGPGNGGFYDIFLFRLGSEPYSTTILKGGPYDGIIVVVVRMKLNFFHNTHDDLRNQTRQILDAIRRRFNDKFRAVGDAKGESFARCRVEFSPRALVANDSGDADYHATVGVSATQTYAQIVAGLDGGTHFDVNVNDTGATTMQTPGGRGRLDFNMKSLNLEADFPRFFAAMIGLGTAPVDGSVLDQPASYVTLVQKVIPNAKVEKLT
jgi:hypothetical protein